MTRHDDEVEKKLQAIEDGANIAASEDTKDSPIRDFVDGILASDAVLFHDQYNDTYIAYDGDGSNVGKIPSKSNKLWLARHSFEKLKKVATSDTINRVSQTLAAQAYFDGEQYVLGVRSVHDQDGLWYDLGGSAVHVTKNQWNITDQPPIVFKRFAHQKQQVLPKRGGDLLTLLKYVNIADEAEQLLFLIYVVSAFIPDYPHPLLILYGAQGAGKTTPMKMVKELIDPSALSGLSTPKNIEVFVQTASHHSFLFYDNLSKMPEWFSDALARVATGDSFSKRELYTDDDIIYRLQNTIALNGINQIVYKPDLLDRSILIHLERISPEKRKEHKVLWAEFERDRPFILGAIFDTLASALAFYPDVKLNRLPRMADFTRFGYAIAEAAGFGGEAFISAYDANIAVQHDEAIEANPVSKAIMAFMKERDEWQGTAADLYLQLNKLTLELQIGLGSGWPKDAPRLGRALTIIAPNLLAKGIELERSRAEERLITIRKITDGTVVTDGIAKVLDESDRQYNSNDSKSPMNKE